MRNVTIPEGGSFRLRNVAVPATLLADPRSLGVSGEMARLDITIERRRVARLAPVSRDPLAELDVDLDGGMAWPCFADIHTHLDKGHTWPRATNPDGTHAGAGAAVTRDRAAHWTAEDVTRRFRFGLACAFAHGAKAVRTHIDSHGSQGAISWPVFRALREEWAGRVHLQGVSLVPIDAYRDEAAMARTADLATASRGLLGASIRVVPELDLLLGRVFALAEQRGLDLDLHVDENSDVGATALERIAAVAQARRFPGRILVGHCCNLALQTPDIIARTIDGVAAAQISVVSLPMCNLYLQGRQPHGTPRWRGVTLLHELAAAGVRVMVASDNCRDPFHAYGDHDPLEVFTQAVRIAHLDCPIGDWPRAITLTPAATMGLDAAIAEGAPADLVLFRARSFSEILSRVQSDRLVLRDGAAIDTTLPDYRELDETLGLALR